MTNRPIIVRQMDLRWFFSDKQNFMAFSRLLKDLPSKVYSSRLLKGLLRQYWGDTQMNLVYWQFAPHVTYALLSIVYFIVVLPELDHIDENFKFDDASWK